MKGQRVGPELDLDAALGRLGYEGFRPGQREAIATLLRERRLLLVAPTGGGKSLAYQLPATLLGGTTIVISPLVALMQDQALALEQRGVPVTFLSSTLEPAEMRRRMARAAEGAFQLLYIAPERLVFPGFRQLLGRLAVPLVAVDEAHCISQWGHDFRPEYLQIGDLLADLRPPRVLACTATATPVVRDEIVARLGLGADTPQIVRGFSRPNLVLRAVEVSSRWERERRVDAQLAEALGQPGRAAGVAIVYSMTRNGAEQEAARLAGLGWRSVAYHAGLEREARGRAQRAFSEGRVEVVAATVAFGMGIDRPDVRAVVHLSPPDSIEAYYQEVGRAGRDGRTAWGLLLTAPRDMPARRRLLELNAQTTPELLEHKWNLYLEMMRWVEGGSCRHDAILRYFGDEAEALAGCGRCDVCEALANGDPAFDEAEATLIVRKALSGVARVHGRLGMSAAAKLLRGEADQRLARAGLDRTSTYGVLRDRDEGWVLKLLRRCVTAGWVEFSADARPVVRLTAAGRAVMKAERPARLLLPPLGGAAASGGKAGRLAPAPAKRPPDAIILDAAGQRLFDALRRHRLQVSRELGVPPFVVASDRTLRDLATLRPSTQAALLAVYGIGTQKAQQFGRGFLEVIAEFAGKP